MLFRGLDRPVPAFLTILAFAASASGGPAQAVNLNGNVFDGSGGPLLPGTVYHAVGFLTVPAGQTLTVGPGAIVKFGPGLGLDVNGTLLVNGTAAGPAIFTSIQDDSAGGDTNGNGPSTGTPTDWRGIRLLSTADASSLTRATVRFGGHSGWAGIGLSQCDANLDSCTVAFCAFAGLNLETNSRPSVTACAFIANGGTAVISVPIDAVPGFLNNTAAGNAGGNYLRVYAVSMAGNLTIGPANLIGGVLVFSHGLSVPAGTTLTLLAGVVAKLENNGLLVDVYGTLLTQGTAAAPVVFTSFRDDAYGGDTNGDGPSSGAPLDWRGLRFGVASDSSVLERTLVRFGGSFGWAGIQLISADITMRDSVIQSCAFSGLQLTSDAQPSVRGCAFTGNGAAAALVTLDAVPGFLHNTASGNAGGDYLLVNPTAVTGSRTITRSSLIGGVLVFSSSGSVPAGASLTFGAGVIMKFQPGGLFDVSGSLNLLGTGFEPVVFTSFADDAYGGDTNQDGPSVGAPHQWLGLRVNGGAGPSLLEYVRLRFGGNAGFPLLQAHSPQATLRSIRAEFSGDRGFYLTAHAEAHLDNLVAFGNATDGIQVGGGNWYLQFATSVNNGGAGVRKVAFYTGSVQNTIAWGNLGGNFVGLTGSQLVNSNGDITQAGNNGNTFMIPGFVDQNGGDLHLVQGAAMLDQADFGAAVDALKDHEENSRALDDDINSVALADRGAYERAFWDMTVAGEPRPGATLTFTVQSISGLSIYGLGALDGWFQAQPYGFVVLGTAPIVLGAVPVGTPLSIAIPDVPALIGFTAGIQTLTFPVSYFFVGSVTRLYRATIRP